MIQQLSGVGCTKSGWVSTRLEFFQHFWTRGPASATVVQSWFSAKHGIKFTQHKTQQTSCKLSILSDQQVAANLSIKLQQVC